MNTNIKVNNAEETKEFQTQNLSKPQNVKKKALMCATVASMIGQFNMDNIAILQSLGYEVHVACNFKDTSVWTTERIDAFVRQCDKIGVVLHQIVFARSPKKISCIIKSYQEIKQLLFSEKYTLVHVHTPIAAAEIRIAARAYNKWIYKQNMKIKKNNAEPKENYIDFLKVIYTAHGFHFYDGAPKKNWLLYYPVERLLSRYTDVLITINNEDYSRAKKEFHAKKVVKIPGVGVDTAKFEVCQVDKVAKRQELDIPEDAFLILSVGELSDRKNQRVVIEAIATLKTLAPRDFKHIYYILAGTGPLATEFKNLIISYDLGSHVKLLGMRTDIGDLNEVSDCFVHTSVREGLGIAPLEAMATGRALISAYVNGIKDYTEDGKTGICLSDPTDVIAMAEAILKMYRDISFRNKCAAYNYERAKAFDIHLTDEIMQKVYRGRLSENQADISR